MRRERVAWWAGRVVSSLVTGGAVTAAYFLVIEGLGERQVALWALVMVLTMDWLNYPAHCPPPWRRRRWGSTGRGFDMRAVRLPNLKRRQRGQAPPLVEFDQAAYLMYGRMRLLEADNAFGGTIRVRVAKAVGGYVPTPGDVLVSNRTVMGEQVPMRVKMVTPAAGGWDILLGGLE